MPRTRHILVKTSLFSFRLNITKSPIYHFKDLYLNEDEILESIENSLTNVEYEQFLKEYDVFVLDTLNELQYILYDENVKKENFYFFEKDGLSIKEHYSSNKRNINVTFSFKESFSFTFDWIILMNYRDSIINQKNMKLSSILKEKYYFGIIRYFTYIDSKIINKLQEEEKL